MRRRVARQGRYAGQPFYGCSRWPDCTATLRIDEVEEEELPTPTTAQALPPAPVRPQPIPRPVTAAPLRPGLRVSFFQSCPLPAPWVTALHREDADRDVIRAAAQWRLDGPSPRARSAWPQLGELLATAESILLRGTAPYCSPSMEAFL